MTNMKIYTEQENGHFQLGLVNIPPNGNRRHKLMLEEVEKGKAEMVHYVTPTENPNDPIILQISQLKSEKVIDAMIDFMDGKKTTFTKFKKELDELKAKLK